MGMYKYLIYFLAFSFLGWVTEVVFSFFKNGHFTNRGMCLGPFCPVYGVGMCLSYLLLFAVDNYSLLALLSMAIATFVEFLVGLFADRVLGKRLWDYSLEKGNILGYVCPRFSLIWGLVCAAVIKTIPRFDPLIDRLASPVLFGILFVIFLVLMVDVKMSMLKLINGNKSKIKQL
jgi:uncharacterized membrane protein